MSDELIAEAKLGDAANEFIQSDLCRYMLGIAEQEIQLAQEAFGDVSPTDVDAIRDLQFKVKVAKQFPQWLKETIDIGSSALEALKDGQS